MDFVNLVCAAVNEVNAEYSVDSLSAEMRLREDLALTSIDLIHLLGSITHKLGGRKLPYETLFFQDGVMRDELTIGELADFIATSGDAPPPAPQAM